MIVCRQLPETPVPGQRHRRPKPPSPTLHLPVYDTLPGNYTFIRVWCKALEVPGYEVVEVPDSTVTTGTVCVRCRERADAPAPASSRDWGALPAREDSR